jgi:predicted RNA-binding protein YlqC (UPF0109 family)
MANATENAIDLVEFLAKSIVKNADAIKVSQRDDTDTLELETDDADRGRVIGSQGRVAKALRAVLAATPGCSGYRLEIVD